MMINAHAHVFTTRHVPADFLPAGFIRLLSERWFTRPLGKLLSILNPFSDTDQFNRYATFMKIGSKSSQRSIFLALQKSYEANMRFVLLSMDMEFMKAGRPDERFDEQLAELARLKTDFPDTVFPFVCADARRPDVFDLVRRCLEEDGFQGIKLYPPLGYYPCDAHLGPIFRYAMDNEVPIITHCSRGGVYYRGTITDDMLVHPKTGERFDRQPNKKFTDHFTDPANYEFLLTEFPDLKICLAHFGGESEFNSDPESWASNIAKLVRKYPNVYTDVSYTMHKKKLHTLLLEYLRDPAVAAKVLYGSDYYLLEQDLHEDKFLANLRRSLTVDQFDQIASVNPVGFLSSRLHPIA